MNGAAAAAVGGLGRGGVPAPAVLNGAAAAAAAATVVDVPPPPPATTAATTSQQAPAAPKMLQCGACNQPFSDPCLLDCFHTVCAPCLRPLVDMGKRQVACPFCG